MFKVKWRGCVYGRQCSLSFTHIKTLIRLRNERATKCGKVKSLMKIICPCRNICFDWKMIFHSYRNNNETHSHFFLRDKFIKLKWRSKFKKIVYFYSTACYTVAAYILYKRENKNLKNDSQYLGDGDDDDDNEVNFLIESIENVWHSFLRLPKLPLKEFSFLFCCCK